MDYVPTPAAAFQSSAQRISRVFACLQSSISSMHHITRSTCLGELPASLCHCASQKSCRPWSSWPACQYSAGIRSLPRRAACHLLSSRGLRPWSSCQPACILQASVRAGASCVPSPCHREIFVPGRAASLPAFCRHPFVPGRASVPSPSIARSSCLVELPACLQVCKRPFVPRRASCHLLSSRGLRACSSYKPACILHASVRDRASCVPHFCHRASQSLRASSSCPACLHSAGISSCRASCVPSPVIARCFVPGRAASLPCILQATGWCWGELRAISYHREIFVPGRAASLPAFCSIRSCCGELRARILPSRIARSLCLVELPACLHSAGHPFVPGRAACLNPAIAHRKVSVPGRASSLPAFCRHPFVPWRAACQILPIAHRKVSVPGRAASLPAFCRHPFVPGRAACQNPAIAHSKISAPGQAASLPAFCRHPLVLWRAACQNPAIAHRKISVPGQAASLPAFCRHPFALGQTAWQTPAIAHRKVSMPGRAASLPAFCRHPFVPGRAACQNPAIAHRKISVPGQAASLPAFCRHPFALGQTAWQTPAIAHRKVSVPGRAASLPAFCRHPFVPGRAACHHLSSRDLRIWSSCQPACILQSSIRAGASVVPSPIIARSSCLVELPACLHSAGIRSCQGELRAITCHREDLRIWFELSACLHSCSHPLVLWRAACQTPAITHRKVSVHWSSYQPACILQASARAVASCVPESCHRASHGLHAWSSCQPACRLLPSRIAKSPCLVKLPACLHSAGIRSCCGELRARLLPSRIARSPRLVKLPACLHSAGIRSCCGELRARILPSRIARSPCLVSCQPACILQASVRAGANCVADSCHRASQGLRAWSSCQPACILQASVRARASCVPSPVIARSSYLVELSACLHSAVIRSCCGELRARLLPSRIAKSPCLVKLPACLHSAGHPLVRGELRARILPSRIARSPCLVKLLACPHSAGIRSCHGELRARLLPSRIGKSSVPGRASSLPAFCRHPFVPGRAACQNPAIAHRKVSVPGRSCQPACILQTSVRCRGELRARLLPSRIARSPCLVILQASIRAGVSCVPSLVIARSSCLVKLPACLHSAGIRSCRGELRAVRI
ncbi:uncharacterized protein [Maniola hyperantus]|uniref:uncharacterized protein isoform X29 n=1 Tax=Aphantopus hyperantus TaxID=2795564 RepID=UPI00374A0E07